MIKFDNLYEKYYKQTNEISLFMNINNKEIVKSKNNLKVKKDKLKVNIIPENTLELDDLKERIEKKKLELMEKEGRNGSKKQRKQNKNNLGNKKK